MATLSSTPWEGVQKREFPVLEETQVIYLDNAATTQKPKRVLDVMDRFYRERYATVNRSVYGLGQDATQAYEEARTCIQQFINAKRSEEIIYVRGATEAINLVASSYGAVAFKPGDTILISALEHHANIVPWQQICERYKCDLKIVPMSDKGDLIQEDYNRLLEENKVVFVSLTHVSNALGTINPIKTMIQKAHKAGAKVLIDGAQAAPHMAIDVQDLDCDFYCFSGHKIYGPTGIGVLYGKYDLLDDMVPFLTGGDMIETVTFDKTTFAKPPRKFEAGTPAFVEVLGLAEAVKFIQDIGFDKIQSHESHMVRLALDEFKDIPEIKLIGTPEKRAGVISFLIDKIHAHDVGTLMDAKHVAVRVGHHCAQPVMDRYDIAATIRASIGMYNTREEIDLLVAGLERVQEIFS